MKIVNQVGLPDLEIERYMGILRAKYGSGSDISCVTFSLAEENGIEYVDCKLEFHNTPFERIRRITGYLANVNKFNNAKKAELEDRINHFGRAE